MDWVQIGAILGGLASVAAIAEPTYKLIRRLHQWRIDTRSTTGELTTYDLKKASDPGNKKKPGGKLTDKGIAVCYALFSKGYNRNQVRLAMGISYRAADLRYDSWVKSGGKVKNI